MITWIKKNGSEIQTNDFKGTIEAAEALGWARKGAKKEEKKAPKKPTKKTGK